MYRITLFPIYTTKPDVCGPQIVLHICWNLQLYIPYQSSSKNIDITEKQTSRKIENHFLQSLNRIKWGRIFIWINEAEIIENLNEYAILKSFL